MSRSPDSSAPTLQPRSSTCPSPTSVGQREVLRVGSREKRHVATCDRWTSTSPCGRCPVGLAVMAQTERSDQWFQFIADLTLGTGRGERLNRRERHESARRHTRIGGRRNTSPASVTILWSPTSPRSTDRRFGALAQRWAHRHSVRGSRQLPLRGWNRGVRRRSRCRGHRRAFRR